MASKIIKFRDTEGDSELIKQAREKLGLGNDSAPLRVMLRLGLRDIDRFLEEARFVTQPLKTSEIDFFTSTLNIWLKGQRKQRMAEKGSDLP